MREIKFRGLVDGVWWYATPQNSRWQQFWVVADKETVGQYTGLKSKSGVEIYEGDIISWVTSDGDDWNCEVKFRNGYFHYVEPEPWNKMDFLLGVDDVNKTCMIIGNIHENHGLLEKERKRNGND